MKKLGVLTLKNEDEENVPTDFVVDDGEGVWLDMGACVLNIHPLSSTSVEVEIFQIDDDYAGNARMSCVLSIDAKKAKAKVIVP